ncbi:hypothetical protein PSY31_23710, partial [Shigella flexneri]|nr:hypothetical protein [Shigella flexneri]
RQLGYRTVAFREEPAIGLAFYETVSKTVAKKINCPNKLLNKFLNAKKRNQCQKDALYFQSPTESKY